MGNTVSTTFTASADQLFRTADAVEKRVFEVAANIDKRFKSVFSQPAIISPKFSDTALKFATNEVKQIETARLRSQRTIESEITKSERAIQRINKITSEQIIRDLKTVENAKQSTFARYQFRQDLGDVLQQSGFGGVGSVIGASGGALAIGASVALLSTGISKTIDLTQTAIEKTIQADRANRLLAASATEAGKSYSFLADQNRKFAASVGLSNTAAAETTAKIAQLATFGGNPSEQNIQKISKSFADLAAARGIDSRDLNTLIGSILSGQDEGLNRLGIADPGKLYEAYAKSIGTTSDKLSQFQKVQAATNAVLDKAGTFSGAAEQRMKSLEGTVARSSAAWDNFTTSLSRVVSSSREVQGAIGLLTVAANQLSKSGIGALDEKIRAGTLTDREIREASERGFLRRALDSSASIPVGFLNSITYGQVRSLRRTNELLQNPALYDATAYQKLQEQVNAQRGLNDAQRRAAEDEQRELREKVAAEKLKTDQQNLLSIVKSGLKARADATSAFYSVEEAKLKAHLDTTKEQELNTIRAISNLRDQQIRSQIQQTQESFIQQKATQALTPKETLELTNETNAQVAKLNAELQINQINTLAEIQRKEREIAEERKKKAEEYKKQLEDIRSLISSNFAQSSQNPFVKIFEDARTSIEKAREATKGFSREIQQAAIQSAQAANGGSLFQQRIGTRLEAFGLQQQAANFLGGQRFQTDFIRDFDAVTGKLLSARPYLSLIGQSSFSDKFNAEQLKQQETLRQQINLIRSTPFADIAGLSAADRNRFINNSIADLFKSVNPADVDSSLRGQAAQALLRQATDKLKEEAAAMQFYEKMNQIITNQGLLVTGASANIEVRSKDVTVETQQQANPARATRNDVKDSMGNYRQAGRWYD